MREAISNLDELHLIERLLLRDSEAWGHFVSQFAPLIRTRVKAAAKECRFHLVDQEIEDVCAEVFKTFIAKDMATLRGFAGRSKLSTWIAVIARRTCLTFLNRRPKDRGEGRVDESSGDLNVASRHEPAIEQIIQNEEFAALEILLKQLQQTDRQILNLYFREGLSYRQIGNQMSISENTVGPKLFRAQSRLRSLARCLDE